MYGTQANPHVIQALGMFENDVNMYGTQAKLLEYDPVAQFENDVNMYGTQAHPGDAPCAGSLRMM